MLIQGNPTNVVLCEGFQVNYLAFTAYTVLPFLACSITGLMALYIQFSKNHIPRRVTAPQSDPRTVLLDPIGAIVGGVALLVTLVLITGTGFAGTSYVDHAYKGLSAWMISLPSAIAKAVFDMVWDFSRNRPWRGRPEGERRSVGVEEGIEMHRVGTDTKLSAHGEDANLSRRAITYRTHAGQNDEHGDTVLSVGPPSLQVISLMAYLTERLNGTKLYSLFESFLAKFPTFTGTVRRLPYALLPFAFAQFILVEALSYTGWINIFSNRLAIVVGRSLPSTIFIVGVLSAILCNLSGTNIGATILLVKILKHPNFANRPNLPPKLGTAGMLALAVGSNIGAVSLTFSASLAGKTP